jgi:hypothetical protein
MDASLKSDSEKRVCPRGAKTDRDFQFPGHRQKKFGGLMHRKTRFSMRGTNPLCRFISRVGEANLDLHGSAAASGA